IVRCYSRTGSNRAAFGAEFGGQPASALDELRRDDEVEGVLISTPHSTHRDLIEQAASAGKHVFVEKPLALTVEEGRRAIQAARRAGVVLSVGHHRRRLGATRRLRRMIDAGELGLVHQLEGQVYNWNAQRGRAGWQDDPGEWPAGGLMGRGVHIVDNFLYLAGPVRRAAAFSKKLLGASALDDATVIALEHESGPLGYIGVSMVVPWRIGTAAYGTQASAWSEQDGAKLYLQKIGEEVRTELPVEAGDPFGEEIAEFVRCIRQGGAPETGGPEALEVVAVVEAILASIRSGKAEEVAAFR
ncbi:MAG: Gfo/Idh/MocA family oxidoreductase, partial [Nitrospinota bacterium]